MLLELITLILILLALWIAWGAYSILQTPRVHYFVKERRGPIEIREYPASRIIKAQGNNENDSFRILAAYIFGRNRSASSIAMTAPVKVAMTAPVRVQRNEMAFYLPKEYLKKTPPTPLDKRVHIERITARTLGVICFSWYATPARIQKKSEILRRSLKDYKKLSDAFMLYYNDPWTPPFMRRNEVAIEIKT